IQPFPTPLWRDFSVVRGYLLVCIGVKQHKINIYSQLFGDYSLKIFFVICNSTLPPRCGYRFDNQMFECGGITGGIRVELHVIPPIIPP
ncbi:MAG: hypothetical protein SOU48_10915, partial [Prevotella sp.]|nr:hypothetical protein [Prevotella sp.]